MNFPNQNLKMPIRKVAEKFSVSQRTAKNYLKQVGASKTREQYLQDAKTRREMAWNLRQEGLKFKEIADKLGVTVNNAQQLVRRFKE